MPTQDWNPTKDAVQKVVGGPYERTSVLRSTTDWAANTEYEVPELSGAVVANDETEVFSWIRVYYSVFYGTAWQCEYFVIRCKAADDVQDLSDSAVLEPLQRAHRILRRGWMKSGGYGWSTVDFELHNVKLEPGEELRMVIRPFLATTDIIEVSVLEYRKVGG